MSKEPQGPPPYPAGGVQPPPPQMQPMQPMPAQVYIAPQIAFGYDPQRLDACPRCNASIVTEVRYENGLLCWIIFGILFVLGFFLLIPWCLCWIPFCIDGCKDVIHVCPNCHQILGRKNRA